MEIENNKLEGKVLILNVLMVSKIWYVLYVSEMPLWTEKRLKKCFLDFLWEGKPARIAYNTILGAGREGGLRFNGRGTEKKWFESKNSEEIPTRGEQN